MSSRPSAIALVAANLVPLAGVLLFDWQVLDILILYWAENVVIGAINVLRMFVCLAGRGVRRAEDPAPRRPKLLLIPFFALHYGLFCFGHYTAVMAIFAEHSGSSDLLMTLTMPLAEAWRSPFWIGIVAITASHLISFFGNFIGDQEYRRTNLSGLIRRPYGRIVVLHVTIVAGGALVVWLGSPLPMLFVLIAAKVGIDLHMHHRERQTFSRQPLPSQAALET